MQNEYIPVFIIFLLLVYVICVCVQLWHVVKNVLY